MNMYNPVYRGDSVYVALPTNTIIEKMMASFIYNRVVNTYSKTWRLVERQGYSKINIKKYMRRQVKARYVKYRIQSFYARTKRTIR